MKIITNYQGGPKQINFSHRIHLTTLFTKCESCYFDRASTDEFSVECLF